MWHGVRVLGLVFVAVVRTARIDVDQGTISASAYTVPKPSRPNVLYLISDDMRPSFGSVGEQGVTPNIDALMKKSLYVANAYSQYPQCAPSRSSFLTSRRPKDTTVITNFASRSAPYTRFKSIPQAFLEHGYNTMGLGKTFHFGGGCENDQRWMTNSSKYPCYRAADVIACGACGNENVGYCRVGVACKEEFPANPSGGVPQAIPDFDCTAEEYDSALARATVEYLKHAAAERRRKATPWFIMSGFRKPHAPFQASAACFEKTPSASMRTAALDKLPANAKMASWSSDMIGLQTGGDACTAILPPTRGVVPAEAQQQNKAAYLASLCEVDSNIGVVMDALSQQGEGTQTIVVLHSDHGFHLGEQGAWGKNNLWEVSLRSPILLSVPWIPESHGTTSNAIAELVDVGPSLVSLAGLSTPQEWSGVDLSPLLTEPSAEVKPYAYSQVTACNVTEFGELRGLCKQGDHISMVGYSVRSPSWRYTRWMRTQGESTTTATANWEGEAYEELYAHTVGGNSFDDQEHVNVAGEAKYASNKQQLLSMLRKGMF